MRIPDITKDEMAFPKPTLKFFIGPKQTLFTLPASLFCSHSPSMRYQVSLTNRTEWPFPQGKPEVFNDLVDWMTDSGPAPKSAPLEIAAADFTEDELWRLIYLYLVCEKFEVRVLQNQIINIVAEGCIKYWVRFTPAQIDHLFDDKYSNASSPLRRLAAKLIVFLESMKTVSRKDYKRCVRYHALAIAVNEAREEVEAGGVFEVYTWMDCLCAFHHHEDGKKCAGLNIIPIRERVSENEGRPGSPADKPRWQIHEEFDKRGRWPWAWWDQEDKEKP
ncbi:MAG: hypothetical protein M1812_002690 [Candelaria pacifica]|nr:MAG: hypothetical protein M1812_002690 [Candelaria pacifica]